MQLRSVVAFQSFLPLPLTAGSSPSVCRLTRERTPPRTAIVRVRAVLNEDVGAEQPKRRQSRILRNAGEAQSQTPRRTETDQPSVKPSSQRTARGRKGRSAEASSSRADGTGDMKSNAAAKKDNDSRTGGAHIVANESTSVLNAEPRKRGRPRKPSSKGRSKTPTTAVTGDADNTAKSGKGVQREMARARSTEPNPRVAMSATAAAATRKNRRGGGPTAGKNKTRGPGVRNGKQDQARNGANDQAFPDEEEDPPLTKEQREEARRQRRLKTRGSARQRELTPAKAAEKRLEQVEQIIAETKGDPEAPVVVMGHGIDPLLAAQPANESTVINVRNPEEELVLHETPFRDGRYGACFNCGAAVVIPGLAQFYCEHCGWIRRPVETKTISPGHHD